MPIWMMRRGRNVGERPESTAKKRNGSQCESIANPPSAGMEFLEISIVITCSIESASSRAPSDEIGR